MTGGWIIRGGDGGGVVLIRGQPFSSATTFGGGAAVHNRLEQRRCVLMVKPEGRALRTGSP